MEEQMVVCCYDREEYQNLMAYAAEQGYTWQGGTHASEISFSPGIYGDVQVWFMPDKTMTDSMWRYFKGRTDCGPVLDYTDFAANLDGVVDMEF